MSRYEIASPVTACQTCWPSTPRQPADKTEIHTQHGLRLICRPGNQTVEAETHISPTRHRKSESVRGLEHRNAGAMNRAPE